MIAILMYMVIGHGRLVTCKILFSWGSCFTWVWLPSDNPLGPLPVPGCIPICEDPSCALMRAFYIPFSILETGMSRRSSSISVSITANSNFLAHDLQNHWDRCVQTITCPRSWLWILMTTTVRLTGWEHSPPLLRIIHRDGWLKFTVNSLIKCTYVCYVLRARVLH